MGEGVSITGYSGTVAFVIWVMEPMGRWRGQHEGTLLSERKPASWQVPGPKSAGRAKVHPAHTDISPMGYKQHCHTVSPVRFDQQSSNELPQFIKAAWKL